MLHRCVIYIYVLYNQSKRTFSYIPYCQSMHQIRNDNSIFDVILCMIIVVIPSFDELISILEGLILELLSGADVDTEVCFTTDTAVKIIYLKLTYHDH